VIQDCCRLEMQGLGKSTHAMAYAKQTGEAGEGGRGGGRQIRSFAEDMYEASKGVLRSEKGGGM